MGPTLTSDERAGIIATASMAGIKTLTIIGNGEPTENFPLMREVIEAAHAEGMTTIMFSTTHAMTREQAEFYRDHGVSIFVSLDSLNGARYRWLTGVGNIEQVVRNINMLREVYAASPVAYLNGKRVVRLGVNVTVSSQNVDELAGIRAFCGDDMQFVANPPMRRGRLSLQKRWDVLGGDPEYDRLENAARQWSETGGHSSVANGVCSYFYRGISVDVDGEIMTCGYAAETATRMSNARHLTVAQVNAHQQDIQNKYALFGRHPSCPVRDPDFQAFVDLWPRKQ